MGVGRRGILLFRLLREVKLALRLGLDCTSPYATEGWLKSGQMNFFMVLNLFDLRFSISFIAQFETIEFTPEALTHSHPPTFVMAI